MTVNEFQRKYHDYQTFDVREAMLEAIKINEELEYSAEGPVVVVNFGDLGFGLMLKAAADAICAMGILGGHA